jgi:DNA polymerase I-like protein with 3'-5' exonuclease and polymerase domains
MYSGINMDAEMWRSKCDEDTTELNKLITELNDYVVSNFPDSKYVDNQLDMFSEGLKCNILWSSSKQVVEFFEDLDLDVRDQKTGKKTVDKKHLVKIADKHEIVPLYIKYSEQAKLVSTYGYNFLNYINPKSGRVHTVFSQIMDTGRLSSGKTDRKKKIQYPNLQNIPSDNRHRHCFVPEKGNKLIVGDYSGQEQIVLANKSMEPNLLEFYRKDLGDMHAYVASMIFPELADVDLKVIKSEHKDKRQLAKGAGFAIN